MRQIRTEGAATFPEPQRGLCRRRIHRHAGRGARYHAAAMDGQLKSRLASMLRRPRPLKPQTERQLASYLAEHSSKLSTFLMCAPDVLEDYELEIVFGPLFTPTLDERAELADLLLPPGDRPTTQQLDQLVKDLRAEVPFAAVLLPDGTQAQLALHEVMIDRYLRLLRLEEGPDAATASSLRDALPAELWSIAIALCSERGMTTGHQRWFAAFVHHASARHDLTRAMLETTTEFIAQQKSLEHHALLTAAEALSRATEGTAAYAAGGHAYWSPDVAQHHQYRGEGKIDQERLEQRQAETERVAMLVEDIRTFDDQRGSRE